MVGAMVRRSMAAAALVGLCTRSQYADASSMESVTQAKTQVKLVSIHPHNASAFTEGLLFLDDTLVESTGLARHSFIRQYKLSNPTDVEVAIRFALESDDADDDGDGSDTDGASGDDDDDVQADDDATPTTTTTTPTTTATQMITPTPTPKSRAKAKVKAAATSTQLLNEFQFDAEIFGEGIACIGDKIFALTYKQSKVLVLSKADFSLVGTHPFHTSTGEGWGMTTDGRLLIVSDGSASIQFYDPQQNFKRVRTIEVTSTATGEKIDQINELEYVEGEILANVWFKNLVLRIDPASGRVVEVLDLSWIPAMVPNLLTMSDQHMRTEAVMNGIAYNPKSRHVFVTGKLWDSIFELELSYLKPHALRKTTA